MGKKQKKTGKGAEKTAAKTDKKLSQKLRKQLAASGEDDIETILAQIEKEEHERCKVVEKIIGTSPTRRAFCSLNSHPYKDELIMFGGEYHNGHETWVYKDLFIYKITTDEWIFLKIPGGPPPRTSHQAVVVPSNKGELWIFGGEFTTKSESQFYHYRDLWVLQLDTKQWTQIKASGGPSARSGHRMVLCKRHLIVFGGYHDNLQDCKYFNDVHAFNLDDRTWTKIEPTGTPPLPRSGCQMVATPEGKIIIWGGYSKSKAKKDLEIGICHTDMVLLSPEKGDSMGVKWKWSAIKAGGIKCGPRSGVSATLCGNKVFTFGGSSDHETEEELTAEFHNELYTFDIQRNVWSEVSLTGKKENAKGKRRKGSATEDECIEEESSIQACEMVEQVVEDGVFTLRVGATSSHPTSSNEFQEKIVPQHPHPRINASLTIKNSKLYLYGGIYEDGDIQHTLSDFHVLDLHKLDEWKTLIPCELNQEWIASSSESSDSETSTDIEEMEE
uniref:Kelch domain-containing protein 4 n=1 Tax=Panstrongylus lignarius TaxID=156445 RepID=A0A224XNU8_9HEMI